MQRMVRPIYHDRMSTMQPLSSRIYVPKSLWPEIRAKLSEEVKKIRVGDPHDTTIFMSAVIDARAFDRIKQYIDYGKSASGVELVYGGGYDNSKGYFVEPTCFVVDDPQSKLLKEVQWWKLG